MTAPWTKSEIAILERDYVRLGAVALAEQLPGRSPQAIVNKASKCGIANRNNKWKTSHVQALRRHYPTGGMQACRQVLADRTEHQIESAVRRFGIRSSRSAAL